MEEPYLLFFDTFDHSKKKNELHVDTIWFKQPVRISEIRIIPFGVAVESNLSAEAYLAATNPTSFDIEFFVHTSAEHFTFERLGGFKYDERDRITNFRISNLLASSILLMRGRYTTMTIALFGYTAEINPPTSFPGQPFPLTQPPPTGLQLPGIFPNQPPPRMGAPPPQPPNFAPGPPPRVLRPSMPTFPPRSLPPPIPAPGPMNYPPPPIVMRGPPPHGQQGHLEPGEIFDSASGDHSQPPTSTGYSREHHRGAHQMQSHGGQRRRDHSGPGPSQVSGGSGPRHLHGNQSGQQSKSVDQQRGPEEKKGEVGQIPVDSTLPPGLYEDGEIQDVDYEEISSDEDILSELEEPELVGVDGDIEGVLDISLSSGLGEYTAGTGSVNAARWKFMPDRLVQDGSAVPKELLMLPDPALTLYQIERMRVENQVENDVVPEDAKKLIDLVEKFGSNPHDADWIEALERLGDYLRPGLAYLDVVDTLLWEKILDILVTWSTEGLDVGVAFRQPNNTMILRHIRVGISLTGLLSSLDERVLRKLLDRSIQEKLIDLFQAPFVATTLKLHLMRALDLTTRLSLGIDAFLGRMEGEDKARSEEDVPLEGEEELQLNTSYKKMIGALFTRKTTRVTAACTRLLNKLHAYEVMLDFKDSVQELLKIPDDEKEARKVTEKWTKSNELLEEIFNVFVNADQLIANPRSTLPCQVAFDPSNRKPHNPYPNFFHMLHSTDFFASLEAVICRLTSSPTETQQMEGLRKTALSFVDKMAQTHYGLLFLMSRPQAMGHVLRQLMGLAPYPEKEEGDDVAAGDKSEVTEEKEDADKEDGVDVDRVDRNSYLLAEELVYKFAALKYFDILLDFNKRDPTCSQLDDESLLRALFGLNLLTGDKQAVRWTAQVLGMDEHPAALLPLLEAMERDTGEREDSEVLPKPRPPIVFQYLPGLVFALLRHCDDITYLGRYGHPLHAMGKDSSSRLVEVQEWLSPLRELPASSPLDLEALPSLVTHLKAQLDDAEVLPPGMITNLRLLKRFLIPPVQANQFDKIEVVKFKYAVVEVYTSDGLTTMVKIMEKLTELVQPLWQQGIEQVDSRYPLVLSVLEPLAEMVCCITQHLIRARGSDFKDTTALPVLFNAFNVFCASPSALRPPAVLEKIRESLVETVLAYTQPQLPHEESEEALDKSPWTCMLRELLNFTVTTPCTFLGGLVLLVELLPLPLPIQSTRELSELEVKQLVAARTLWSAHLLCLQPELRNMLQLLGCSSNPQLCQMVRRVCRLWSELSPACGRMVSACALEGLVEVWDRCRKEAAVVNAAHAAKTVPTEEATDAAQPGEEGMEISVISGVAVTGPGSVNLTLTGDGPVPPGEAGTSHSGSLYGDSLAGGGGPVVCPDSTELTRVLSMLRLVLTVPACKHAALKLLGQDGEASATSEEKYQRVIGMMVELLQAHTVKENHVPTQEMLINCIKCLVNIEVSLTMGGGPGSKYTLSNLANALPSVDKVILLTKELTAHVNHPDQDLATVHLALKTLVLLAEHDHGFCIVKEAVTENHKDVFLNLIKRVNETFNKDNPDCQVTLLTTLELLRTLVITDSLAGESMPLRSQAITVSEVKQLLQWGADQDENTSHPVTDLHGLLKLYVNEENSLEILLESMESLIKLLATPDDGLSPPVVPPSLPPAHTLEAIYETRGVWTLLSSDLEEEECLTPAFWFELPAPPDEEGDHPELVRCDLDNLAYTCCSGFKLQEELARGSQRDEDAVRHKKRRPGQDAIIHTAIQNKKFVAPMRGRGFNMRSGMSSGGASRHDPFRSRPANTSRPPSMHVDDFVKMENEEDIIVEDMNPSGRADRGSHGFKGRGGGFMGRMSGGGGRKPGMGYASAGWERSGQRSDVKVLTSGDMGREDRFRVPQPVWGRGRDRDRNLRSLTK